MIVAVVALWAVVAIALVVSLNGNQGRLVYALDDTYISMAMAKNLSQHGVWGITRYEFTSSSSSLIWPLILAATYRVLGVHEVAPLVWNALFGTLILGLVYSVLRSRHVPTLSLFVSLVTIAFVTPLPALILIGLEHTLHALLSLAVACGAAAELSDDRARFAGARSLLLPTLVSLLVMARYEGLFQTFVIVLLFFARRRWRRAFVLAGVAALPVFVYGIVSVRHGWHWLPNSVLLKGHVISVLEMMSKSSPFSESFLRGLAHLLGFAGYLKLVAEPHMLFLTALILVLAYRHLGGERSFWDRDAVMMTMFLGTLLLHMQFARTGWLYRYEAYLVAWGLTVVAAMLFGESSGLRRLTSFGASRPAYLAGACLILFPAIAFVQRAAMSPVRSVQATMNIHDQQYQMGLFLRDYYAGETVTVHDMGAVNFLADIRCVNVDGLAGLEALSLRQSGRFTREALSRLAGGTGIALMYDGWMGERGGVPPDWVMVGTWTIRNNIIAAEDTISFYAVDHGKTADLIAKLRLFASRLPPDVDQGGSYVNSGSS